MNSPYNRSDHVCMDFGPGDVLCEMYGVGGAAMRYLAWGYAVIPLVRGGKRPHRMLPVDVSPGARNGIWHSTTHHQQVADWWSQDKAANVGVATGGRSNLVVLDLDVKRGEDGPGNFTRFMGGYALPEQVPSVVTPSGGWHLWLRTDGGPIPERPGILPGVDVKGDGGLVVAPPSMALVAPMARPGEYGDPVPLPYIWAVGCPCSAPLAPSWLLDWIRSAPAHPANGHAIDHGGLADLDELSRTGIPVGQRNATLYRLACARFRKHGTGPDGWSMVAEDLNRVLAVTDCHGFTATELRTIMMSAHRFVSEQAMAEQAQADAFTRGWVR